MCPVTWHWEEGLSRQGGGGVMDYSRGRWREGDKVTVAPAF